jgi:hypothetical protein
MSRQLNDGKESYFQKVLLRKLDIHMQNNEINPFLMPYIAFNSKCIKNLNLKTKPTKKKLFEENMKAIFHDF